MIRLLVLVAALQPQVSAAQDTPMIKGFTRAFSRLCIDTNQDPEVIKGVKQAKMTIAKYVDDEKQLRLFCECNAHKVAQQIGEDRLKERKREFDENGGKDFNDFIAGLDTFTPLIAAETECDAEMSAATKP